ncbi:hypothetical protein HNE_0493 [Hyphomonas neptunium ATCC 15444]|uniref:Uncharacterized protein n=3 Tax=Hyphomonas TaxID=85 RepID=Q0C4X0_HYPNA|nr:hypothetical protein HNE_0493 [Hyphomonas neptunium ATCC 15444]
MRGTVSKARAASNEIIDAGGAGLAGARESCDSGRIARKLPYALGVVRLMEENSMTRLRYLPLFAFALLAACGPAPEEAPAPISEAAQPAVPEAEPETPAPEMPAEDMADSEMAAEPGTCTDELGAEAAQVLVDQCLAISPATRPPCNAQNSCDMIRGEIRRGCGFGDAADNPEFCSEYQ